MHRITSYNVCYTKLLRKLHRKFEGKLKTATVSRNSTGKFYISILVDDDKEIPEKQHFNDNSTLGIDVGLTHFAILSNSEKIDNPKYLKNGMDRMKVLQKRMSKKQKGSKNRERARFAVSKLHEKISRITSYNVCYTKLLRC